jgi:tRNA(fMet)-specific endonuclease VapC
LAQALAFTRQVNVLPVDPTALQPFLVLKSMPVRIGTNDLRIAATALANQAILATCNQRDFGQVPGLTVENWAI